MGTLQNTFGLWNIHVGDESIFIDKFVVRKIELEDPKEKKSVLKYKCSKIWMPAKFWVRRVIENTNFSQLQTVLVNTSHFVSTILEHFKIIQI